MNLVSDHRKFIAQAKAMEHRETKARSELVRRSRKTSAWNGSLKLHMFDFMVARDWFHITELARHTHGKSDKTIHSTLRNQIAQMNGLLYGLYRVEKRYIGHNDYEWHIIPLKD